MYLHAIFFKNWPKNQPDFFHLKQAIIVFGSDCTAHLREQGRPPYWSSPHWNSLPRPFLASGRGWSNRWERKSQTRFVAAKTSYHFHEHIFLLIKQGIIMIFLPFSPITNRQAGQDTSATELLWLVLSSREKPKKGRGTFSYGRMRWRTRDGQCSVNWLGVLWRHQRYKRSKGKKKNWDDRNFVC